MIITVNGPDDLTVNFPDGTDADTIHGVITPAPVAVPAQPTITASAPGKPPLVLSADGKQWVPAQ